MNYRYLGRSGLLVSRICLGTMNFGMKDWGCNKQVSSKIIGEFIESGGNFIDTADIYSDGISEEILGRSSLKISGECLQRCEPPQRPESLGSLPLSIKCSHRERTRALYVIYSYPDPSYPS